MYVRVRGYTCVCIYECVSVYWIRFLTVSILEIVRAIWLCICPSTRKNSWLDHGLEMNEWMNEWPWMMRIDRNSPVHWLVSFCLFPAGFPILPAQTDPFPPYLSQSGSLRPLTIHISTMDGWKIGLQSPARVFFYFWNYFLYFISCLTFLLCMIYSYYWFIFKKEPFFFFFYLLSGKSAILYLYGWLSTSSSTSLSPSSTPTPPYNTVSTCS